MGQYTLPPGLNIAATIAAAAVAAVGGAGSGGMGRRMPSRLPGNRYFRTWRDRIRLPCLGEKWVKPPPIGSFRASSEQIRNAEKLRVMQLLAPELVGRAKVFGNQLALRADMKCQDMPYFDGPGTMTTPLGPEKSIISPPEVGTRDACDCVRVCVFAGGAWCAI
jgi:hypothetical protein